MVLVKAGVAIIEHLESHPPAGAPAAVSSFVTGSLFISMTHTDVGFHGELWRDSTKQGISMEGAFPPASPLGVLFAEVV